GRPHTWLRPASVPETPELDCPHIRSAGKSPLIVLLISGVTVGIECKACGRRSVLTSEECPHIRPGNKALVRSAKFRCGRQGCGSTDVRLYSCFDRDEADMYLAGDPP